jgi:hypothetical protein
MVVYISRVGRSYPARKFFATRKTLELLNSTRTHGGPVSAGSATELDQSGYLGTPV